MFETYSDIFNQRGKLYHQAMTDHPEARRAEFQTAIALLELAPGMVLCDVPSGGGYLSNFISVPDVKLYAIETSEVFARSMAEQDTHVSILCEAIADLPLVSSSIDRVISLAGLHHVTPQVAFYQEAHRLLTPQGLLVVADVQQGTGVDRFLNGFVDQHSQMGHRGLFLGDHTLTELETCGFQIVQAQPQKYTWQFPNPMAMARYCQMLFGIDLTDEATILDSIQDCLGYQVTDTGCYMNWELLFVQAMKTTAATN
jgi:cyclopropane fatty-acyl-phospholipid synthase-like methyltransferase